MKAQYTKDKIFSILTDSIKDAEALHINAASWKQASFVSSLMIEVLSQEDIDSAMTAYVLKQEYFTKSDASEQISLLLELKTKLN